VFFDDNPAEREQVRQALPEVVVVEVPARLNDEQRALLDKFSRLAEPGTHPQRDAFRKVVNRG
jgi:predicted enzyme involved in methoxymalonyl-ACP biosynthesis